MSESSGDVNIDECREDKGDESSDGRGRGLRKDRFPADASPTAWPALPAASDLQLLAKLRGDGELFAASGSLPGACQPLHSLPEGAGQARESGRSTLITTGLHAKGCHLAVAKALIGASVKNESASVNTTDRGVVFFWAAHSQEKLLVLYLDW